MTVEAEPDIDGRGGETLPIVGWTATPLVSTFSVFSLLAFLTGCTSALVADPSCSDNLLQSVCRAFAEHTDYSFTPQNFNRFHFVFARRLIGIQAGDSVPTFVLHYKPRIISAIRKTQRLPGIIKQTRSRQLYDETRPDTKTMLRRPICLKHQRAGTTGQAQSGRGGREDVRRAGRHKGGERAGVKRASRRKAGEKAQGGRVQGGRAGARAARKEEMMQSHY
ncbi:hypothetical protein C8R47DRAFT_1077096 [Mycena vitilis]|nr:hypothetical protein C8R47DRAFT_1077096 [Mycena vitilis]